MSILAQDRTQREEGISGLVYGTEREHHEANLDGFTTVCSIDDGGGHHNRDRGASIAL
ncbi:hypothetical protein [Chamaesiphon minutus]|uniref:hypothetical protein n=1 Tax=Chamaesiphon minutus TaxID=1173032 RepID=UPI0003122B10|nr:hypothetical protein [Chamaesiphon minutus]